MNRVRQPHTLLDLGLNAEMGTTAGADELVEVPSQNSLSRTKAHPLHLSTSRGAHAPPFNARNFRLQARTPM